MGTCYSCCKNTDIESQPHYEEEKEEEDRLDHGDEEAVEGHEEGDALVHHDVHHDVHHHHHLRSGQSRKKLCRRCNLRLLTLIHVPPRRGTAVDEEEDKKEKTEKMQIDENEITGESSSTSRSNATILQISRADDNIEKVEAELKKPRKPHRDLHVSWRKGHGDFIDHLMFGWHH